MEKNKLTSRPVNNEVDFCKVYDMETKAKVEKILLANRISYCCRFENRGIIQRLFFLKPGEKTICIFRIHDAEVDRAKELLKSVLGEKKTKKKDGKK